MSNEKVVYSTNDAEDSDYLQSPFIDDGSYDDNELDLYEYDDIVDTYRQMKQQYKD